MATALKSALRNRTPDVIAAELWAAKVAEKKAAEARIALEAELIGELGARPEGSETHELDGFKVKVTGKLTRKVTDFASFLDAAIKLPEALRPVKTETKVDEAGLKYLETNEPKLFAKLAKFIEVKPAKTAVDITRTE